MRRITPGGRVTCQAAVFAMLCALYAAAPAQADPFRKGPYLQNVSRTSITVMWESDHASPGRVYLLGDDERTLESPADHMHEVTIDGLSPSRRYRYAVESGSERRQGEFATAPDPGVPFTFIVFGDSRSGNGAHRRVVERIRRQVPDFLLGTGDMVDQGAKEADWQTLFEIERNLLKENVFFPSVGNHDRQGRGRTANNYRKYFSLPENSPDPERYYAFTYGSARFLVLDSNAYSFALTDQTAWIEQQLQVARLDPSIASIFVSMHHPPYSIALHGGQTELREAWTPMFEKYRVAAVFSGHDHVYSRAQRNGVRYFVTGGGGAPLYSRGRRPSKIDRASTRFFERTNHHLKVHVAGEYVEVAAVRSDGTLIETIGWGVRRRQNSAAVAPRPVVPLVGSGAGLQAKDAVAGTGVEPAGGLARTSHASIRVATPSAPTDRGIGLLGKIAALMALLAAGVLFWALRTGA